MLAGKPSPGAEGPVRWDSAVIVARPADRAREIAEAQRSVMFLAAQASSGSVHRAKAYRKLGRARYELWRVAPHVCPASTALATAEELLSVSVPSAPARLMLSAARLREATGDDDGAVELLERCTGAEHVESVEVQRDALALLASIHRRRAQHAKAVDALMKLLTMPMRDRDSKHRCFHDAEVQAQIALTYQRAAEAGRERERPAEQERAEAMGREAQRCAFDEACLQGKRDLREIEENYDVSTSAEATKANELVGFLATVIGNHTRWWTCSATWFCRAQAYATAGLDSLAVDCFERAMQLHDSEQREAARRRSSTVAGVGDAGAIPEERTMLKHGTVAELPRALFQQLLMTAVVCAVRAGRLGHDAAAGVFARRLAKLSPTMARISAVDAAVLSRCASGGSDEVSEAVRRRACMLAALAVKHWRWRKTRDAAATRITRAGRRRAAVVRARRRRVELHNSATKVQSVARGRASRVRTRRLAMRKRNAARRIQRQFRQHVAAQRERERAIYEARCAALDAERRAWALSTLFGMFEVRKARGQLRNARGAATAIQCAWRCFRARVKVYREQVRHRHANDLYLRQHGLETTSFGAKRGRSERGGAAAGGDTSPSLVARSPLSPGAARIARGATDWAADVDGVVQRARAAGHHVPSPPRFLSASPASRALPAKKPARMAGAWARAEREGVAMAEAEIALRNTSAASPADMCVPDLARHGSIAIVDDESSDCGSASPSHYAPPSPGELAALAGAHPAGMNPAARALLAELHAEEPLTVAYVANPAGGDVRVGELDAKTARRNIHRAARRGLQASRSLGSLPADKRRARFEGLSLAGGVVPGRRGRPLPMVLAPTDDHKRRRPAASERRAAGGGARRLGRGKGGGGGAPPGDAHALSVAASVAASAEAAHFGVDGLARPFGSLHGAAADAGTWGDGGPHVGPTAALSASERVGALVSVLEQADEGAADGDEDDGALGLLGGDVGGAAAPLKRRVKKRRRKKKKKKKAEVADGDGAAEGHSVESLMAQSASGSASKSESKMPPLRGARASKAAAGDTPSSPTQSGEGGATSMHAATLQKVLRARKVGVDIRHEEAPVGKAAARKAPLATRSSSTGNLPRVHARRGSGSTAASGARSSRSPPLGVAPRHRPPQLTNSVHIEWSALQGVLQ